MRVLVKYLLDVHDGEFQGGVPRLLVLQGESYAGLRGVHLMVGHAEDMQGLIFIFAVYHYILVAIHLYVALARYLH
jgi:hypothetical protein